MPNTASCGSIWLDHGEADRVIAIGHKMVSRIEAERARAHEEMMAMGKPDFGPLSQIAALLSRFSKPR